MKKIIRVDIFKGVFAKTPVDTMYQIVKGEGKPMNEYCVNDKCKNKYKCPIYHYANEKVTSKFFLIKNDPKNCKYYKEKYNWKGKDEKNK